MAADRHGILASRLRLPRASRAFGPLGGRITAALLLLLWGAFFIEHTQEWFLGGVARQPPGWVLALHAAHFAMLAGLGLMWRWERTGALVFVVASAAFFGGIGVHRFPAIALINLLPVALFAIAWRAGAKPAGEPARP
jgi:hypothetical protein